MADSEVRAWFEGLPAERREEWLQARPPAYAISEELAKSVPAEHRETTADMWVTAMYTGWVGHKITETTRCAFGKLATFLAEERGER